MEERKTQSQSQFSVRDPRFSKLLVVGLDGATFDLLRSWMEAGALPTFRSLMESGASGILMSTIPPLTPPAWVSSVTGVNPGKHGVFDFITNKGDYRPRPIRSSDWCVEPIWLQLGREGFRVGVVNFPAAYPPFEVSGFMLTGLLTPTGATDSVYPVALAGQIKRAVLDENNLVYGNHRAFLKDLQRVTRLQTATAQHLANRFNVEFLQVIYDGVDRLQHYFWHFIHEAATEAETILQHYQCLDQAVATLLSSFPSPRYVVIYSDHGFGPLYRCVHVENVLADLGLLKWRDEAALSMPRWQKVWTKRRIESLAYKLGFGSTLKRWLPQSWKNALPDEPIQPYRHVDWSGTKAYFASMSAQSIRVNLNGREPAGIVAPEEYESVRQQVIEGLMQLTDPLTAQPVIDRVYRREEIYHGPWVEQADDLIVCTRPGYYLVGGRGRQNTSDPDRKQPGWSGVHRAEGIVMLNGPGIRAGAQLESSCIEDIAPTLLYLMGMAVPDYMDGRVLTSAFEADFLRAQPIIVQPASLPLKSSPTDQSKWDDVQMMNRLKDLGYLE